MSRGGLLLRAAREGRELDYVPLAGAVRSAAARGAARPAYPGPPHARTRRLAPTGDADVRAGRRAVHLTNLRKPFWPEQGITKGDLLQYYFDLRRVCCRICRDRAHGHEALSQRRHGQFFFMKRAPSPRPDWIETCAIEHASASVIDFPMVQDLAVAALGGQPRLHRPEPVVRALRRRGPPRLPPLRSRSRSRAPLRGGARDRAAACATRSTALGMPSYAKTTGSRGIHVYVPIVRGPDAEGGLALRQGLRAGAGGRRARG